MEPLLAQHDNCPVSEMGEYQPQETNTCLSSDEAFAVIIYTYTVAWVDLFAIEYYDCAINDQ